MSAFKKLENKLEKRPGVTNPAGLAEYLGMLKFGKAGMEPKAEAGRMAMKKAALVIAFSLLSIHGASAQISALTRPIMSTAIEASHVISAVPAAMYTLTVTDSATEYILIIDATSLPSNGAVTLLYPPISVAANTTVQIPFPQPLTCKNGIVVCNSSTGTFTKTIGGSTCVFHAQIR